MAFFRISSIFLCLLVIVAVAQDGEQQGESTEYVIVSDESTLNDTHANTTVTPDPPPSSLRGATIELKFIQLVNAIEPFKPLTRRFFANLPALENVTITSSVSSLPEDLFVGSYSLMIVHISHNTFMQIPEYIFANQSKIVSINLSNNRLESLPAKLFIDTVNLRVLHLNNNRLRYIQSQQFKQLKQLGTLKLQYNRLVSIIHVQFPEKNQLIELDLGNNQIAHIETLLEQIDSVQNLFLKNNSIKQFPSLGYGWGTHLNYLDLSHNQIKSLSIADIRYIDDRTIIIDLTDNEIEEVIQNTDEQSCTSTDFLRSTESGHWTWRLNKNPFRCDQSLECFVTLARALPAVGWRTGEITLEMDQLKCESPVHLRDRLVGFLSSDDLKAATTCSNIRRAYGISINRLINKAKTILRG